MSEMEQMDITTAGGQLASFETRDDTNDGALVMGIIGESEYPFERMQNLSGWAIDAGAHIGTVSVALALDNPELRVIAVEPVAENYEVLKRNIYRNGLTERVYPLESALGSDEMTTIMCDYRTAGDEPASYVHDNRFIGNIYTAPGMDIDAERREVMGISLTTLLLRYGLLSLAFMKSDTEGAEWTYLADPAMNRVQRVIGEWHGEPGLAGLRKLLPKHKVTQLDDNPTNGIFEAVHR